MALRVKCVEPIDFLYAFLQVRGCQMVNSKPQVLHYTGTSPRELKRLVRENKPDLLITHAIKGFDIVNAMQVYHPLKDKADFNRTTKVYTNRYNLAKHYYEKLGLQVEFKIIPEQKKEPFKFPISFKKIAISDVQIFFRKLSKYLYWE